jgi:hypothetical protein
MEEHGQLHTVATLPLGKQHLGSTKWAPDPFEEKKNFLPLLGIEPKIIYPIA